MTCDDFNRLCQSLPATTCVVQWRRSHVWKVGGKVFAWATPDGATAGITIKVSEIAYAMLKDRPGVRPAPYMASRGLTWIQHYAAPGLSDGDIAAYVRQAYEAVARALPKKARRELGFEPA